MTVTMTAKEWGIFRDQLHTQAGYGSEPTHGFICNIDDLLGQARKIFWLKETEAVQDDGGLLASDVGIGCDEHGPAYPGV
jgi:hypothetical protein